MKKKKKGRDRGGSTRRGENRKVENSNQKKWSKCEKKGIKKN